MARLLMPHAVFKKHTSAVWLVVTKIISSLRWYFIIKVALFFKTRNSQLFHVFLSFIHIYVHTWCLLLFNILFRKPYNCCYDVHWSFAKGVEHYTHRRNILLHIGFPVLYKQQCRRECVLWRDTTTGYTKWWGCHCPQSRPGNNSLSWQFCVKAWN